MAAAREAQTSRDSVGQAPTRFCHSPHRPQGPPVTSEHQNRHIPERWQRPSLFGVEAATHTGWAQRRVRSTDPQSRRSSGPGGCGEHLSLCFIPLIYGCSGNSPLPCPAKPAQHAGAPQAQPGGRHHLRLPRKGRHFGRCEVRGEAAGSAQGGHRRDARDIRAAPANVKK